MADIIDITNVKFGKLTALEPFGKIDRVLSWYCLCDCGMFCFVTGTRLRRLERTSCNLYGCRSVTNAVANFDPTKTLSKKPRKKADTRFVSNKRKWVQEDNKPCGSAAILLAKRHAYLSRVKVGDIVRYKARTFVNGYGYLLATVLKVSGDSFWVRSQAGERWVNKSMVIFFSGVEEENNEAIQQSV